MLQSRMNSPKKKAYVDSVQSGLPLILEEFGGTGLTYKDFAIIILDLRKSLRVTGRYRGSALTQPWQSRARITRCH